ncbi:related to Bis(5'-adenosyl)-triphosphatase [Zygosaccharomyces bailii ISA1307]|nr:related to Bis(5'-adenosyl)-triphosphatase [Zygosaccharomyces bailii ISA1307]
MNMTNAVYFSKFLVTKQVFFQTNHSYALVNLKPLVPGHILIVPLRTQVHNLCDLTSEETLDYFDTLQVIHQFIKWQFKADSLNIAIQDGPEAGQTVPHLHTHVIPRYRLNNVGDRFYEDLDKWRFNDWEQRRQDYLSMGAREGRKAFAKPDDQRYARTQEDMEDEARYLANQLNKFFLENPHLKRECLSL